MTRTYLFDDAGEMWDAKSPSLAEALHASISGDELAKYVVRNLGFVAATQSAASVRLRLRPAIASPTALSALFYWLHDQTIERVLISFLESEWTHELVRSGSEAVRTLLARVDYQANDREGDFLNKQVSLDNLSSSSPLRAVLQAWSDCSGTYNAERIRPVLQKVLNGRYMLVESVAGSPTLHVRDIGGGFNKDVAVWLSRIRGLRVEDQPDYAYGKWIAAMYQQVLRKGEPSLEDVDAVISWPQKPRESFRYKRLVVPFEARGNSTLLLGASINDPAIDLRVKPH